MTFDSEVGGRCETARVPPSRDSGLDCLAAATADDGAEINLGDAFLPPKHLAGLAAAAWAAALFPPPMTWIGRAATLAPGRPEKPGPPGTARPLDPLQTRAFRSCAVGVAANHASPRRSPAPRPPPPAR